MPLYHVLIADDVGPDDELVAPRRLVEDGRETFECGPATSLAEIAERHGLERYGAYQIVGHDPPWWVDGGGP